MAAAAETTGTLYTTSTLATTTYDVVCIGTGQASRPLGGRVVAAGFTALLIEKELIGGDCPYWACVPSKCLLRPSEVLESAKSVQGAAERIENVSVDVSAALARRDAFTAGWDDEKIVVPMTLKTGADLIRGTGRIVGEKRVLIEGVQGETVEVQARHAVVVCTGSVPKIPDIPGLRDAKPWTPREATSSKTVPKHLVVVGAGAVGCEMAMAYASFGAKVTVLSSTPEILPRVDVEAGSIVRKALESRGVEFMLQTRLSSVQRLEDGNITVKTATGISFEASEILIAIGREPQTHGCGLETFGIPVDGSPIHVNDSLQVQAVPGQWLYATGDVNGRSPLTHMCKYHARIAANAILHNIKGETGSTGPWSPTLASADHYAIPSVVFTQPAVGHVGMTRVVANREHRAVRIIQAPSSTLGLQLHGDPIGEGWAQWVVDASSQQLLGMTVVGHDMTDLIHAATVAIVGGLRLDQLAHAVPCFPTISEVYLNLADAAGL